MPELTFQPTRVGLISLGCAKNLIDSEIMIGHMHKAGMEMTPEPAEADVLIVNTCSFIDSANERKGERVSPMFHDFVAFSSNRPLDLPWFDGG